MTTRDFSPLRLPGKLGSLAMLIAIPLALQLGAPALAYAECPEGGYPQACPGYPNMRVCDESLCPPPPDEIAEGEVSPKFLVESLVYAAPGSADCSRTGSITYSTDNTLGTTVTMAESFTETSKASLSLSAGIVGSGGTSVSFQKDEGSANKTTADVKSTQGQSEAAQSVCTDGINHDWDTFRLVFRPLFQVRIDGPSIALTPVLNEQSGVAKFTVGQLKGDQPFSEGQRAAIEKYELTYDDFETILKMNPWSRDANAYPSAERFVHQRTLVYDNFDSEGGRTGTGEGATFVESNTEGHEMTASNSYSVGLSLDIESKFGALFASKLSVGRSWTWTNTATTAGTVENRNSAMMNVGVPSEAYTGAVMMDIYYDTLFRSFVFVPAR